MNSLQVYLGDFGLGKVMTGTRIFGHSTMQAGTPEFQSHEQLRGEDLTISCNVYVLGALLTELFGMRPIWEKQTNHTIIYNVAHLGKVPAYDHIPQIYKQLYNYASVQLHQGLVQLLC